MSSASAPDLAAAAQVLASEARASMALALLDGRAWTLTELARAANIGLSTASAHVDQLVGARLFEEVRQGRHRYLRIAGPAVAETIESLATLTDGVRPAQQSLKAQRTDRALREARSCYHHLAGRLGVALCDGARSLGYVAPDWTLTSSGGEWLAGLGVELPSATNRPLVRPCLDWTERREHLAGVAADLLLATLVREAWITRAKDSRAVRLTPSGVAALDGVLGRHHLVG
jgi:DNA-binding transcriptional ArsR family regulator